MMQQPNNKYRAFAPIHLPNRRWPDQTITQAPIWMSTDLRDGNQALFEPMNGATKLRFFQQLVAMGFKEIEVAFPSASQTDFDFVRCLIDDGHIPDDVTIEVITQAREHLIRRTFEALKGAKRAIVHLYNATAPNFRQTVFNLDQQGVTDIAVNATRLIRELADAAPETEWVFQYSPETFSGTELEFSRDVCNAVMEVWQPTPQHKAIINLPATVELSTPNVFADQIEWMHRHLARRDSIVLSVHPHNDRGCAVAAAELALMAGAERIEGCLFGNGERTGNVDLVTLALNLYTQGIHPGLDFSDINAIARLVEECNQIPVHPRHPYAGDLVFTAFSGSHQDAIKKGFAVQPDKAVWEVPYLPIDPQDIGRSYDSVIRVNSQSGKGGIAWVLENDYGMALPRRLQVEFANEVQRHTDANGGEMAGSDIWSLFSQCYLQPGAHVTYRQHHLFEHGAAQGIRLSVEIDGAAVELTGIGNGPIDAAVQALQTAGIELNVRSFEERSRSASSRGGNAEACAFVEVSAAGESHSRYGVAVHANIVTASIQALVSAANRITQQQRQQVAA